MDTYFELYDEVHIIDTTYSEKIETVLIIENKKVKYVNSDAIINMMDLHTLPRVGSFIEKFL